MGVNSVLHIQAVWLWCVYATSQLTHGDIGENAGGSLAAARKHATLMNKTPWQCLDSAGNWIKFLQLSYRSRFHPIVIIYQ